MAPPHFVRYVKASKPRTEAQRALPSSFQNPPMLTSSISVFISALPAQKHYESGKRNNKIITIPALVG